VDLKSFPHPRLWRGLSRKRERRRTAHPRSGYAV